MRKKKISSEIPYSKFNVGVKSYHLSKYIWICLVLSTSAAKSLVQAATTCKAITCLFLHSCLSTTHSPRVTTVIFVKCGLEQVTFLLKPPPVSPSHEIQTQIHGFPVLPILKHYFVTLSFTSPWDVSIIAILLPNLFLAF